jgi:hypothetical protein
VTGGVFDRDWDYLDDGCTERPVDERELEGGSVFLLFSDTWSIVPTPLSCCVVQVKETRTMTQQARAVLNRMAIRAISHKACMMIIIIILLGLIGVVFYYGIVRRHIQHKD